MSINQTIMLLSEIRKMAQYVVLPSVVGAIAFANRKKIKQYLDEHDLPKVRIYH